MVGLTDPEPVTIDADRAAQRLTIEWSDGLRTICSFETLRWGCPCAVCKGEGGQPGVLASTKVLRPEQFQLESLHGVGLYAVAPVWEDGHDTGIYPYGLLRQLGSPAK